jgi:hypothetical protein
LRSKDVKAIVNGRWLPGGRLPGALVSQDIRPPPEPGRSPAHRPFSGGTGSLRQFHFGAPFHPLARCGLS